MVDEHEQTRGRRRAVAAGLGAAPAGDRCSSRRGSPASAACSSSWPWSFVVVWLPIAHLRPAAVRPTGRRSTTRRSRAATLFASNNCFVCHSGYSRPQDVREALYFLYPKVSQPGDFYGSDQSPNLLGTERTGPDLSQESGWHPDDWQYAHFYDARYVDPRSLMPPMKSLFSDGQVERPDRSSSRRAAASPGLLRYAGQLYAKHDRADRAGLPAALHGLPGRAQADRQAEGGQASAEPARGGAQPLADRPQLLAVGQSAAGDRAEPAARQGGLPRSAASAATGSRATARDPGATFMSPPPADFTDKDDACCGGDTGPGDFYYRILRGWTGTGMENFGERLSVDDIWRVVLFVKTIPNGTLAKDRDPRAEATTSPGQPSKELLAWVKSRQKLADNVVVQRRPRAPTRSCRRRCACSRAWPRRPHRGERARRRRSASQDAAAGHQGASTSSCSTGPGPTPRRAATSCRRSRRRTSRPWWRASNEAAARPGDARVRRGARRARRRARARRARERPVEMGDGRLDDGRLLPVRRARAAGVHRGLEGRPLPRPRAGGADPADDRRGGLLHARRGRSTRRSGPMAMPRGDSPQKVARLLPLPPGPPARAARADGDLARRLDLAGLAVGIRDRARAASSWSGSGTTAARTRRPASARSTAGAATRPRRPGACRSSSGSSRSWSSPSGRSS